MKSVVFESLLRHNNLHLNIKDINMSLGDGLDQDFNKTRHTTVQKVARLFRGFARHMCAKIFALISNNDYLSRCVSCMVANLPRTNLVYYIHTRIHMGEEYSTEMPRS